MTIPSLPAEHPLQRARWIWPNGALYLHNHYAQFRKDFSLDAVPSPAPFFITADACYKLYVNGQLVCRGPARGYQGHYPFDEVDLAPWLRRGANWLSIEGYSPGTSTFRSIFATQARMLCAAEWPGLSLHSAPDWPQRRSPAHRSETARHSMQIFYQEHVDARLDDRSWIHDPSTDAEFSLPLDLRHGDHSNGMSASNACYRDLEERGIPLLREDALAPRAVVARMEGSSIAGWRETSNVSWHWREEERTGSWQHGEAGRAADGWLELTLPITAADRFHAVAIDTGEYVVADLELEVEGGTGGEVLDFQHDERFIDGVPGAVTPGANCSVAMANRLVLRAGRTRHQFFHPLGFRALTVIARDCSQPLTLRIRLRRCGYPFAMRGEFACDDPFWNELHAACRRTQQVCALDAYVDTPWREQAQWWGDARIQAWNTFHLDGDARLLARGIRSIADQDGPEGLTFGHAPTCAYGCVLPDFALTWILTIWDHYWQTGSTELIRERWGRVQQVLAYFDVPRARSAQGLLGFDQRFWLFEDWSSLAKPAVPTFLNLWYLTTLRRLAPLLEAAGMAREAADIADRAEAHQALVLAHLHDPASGLFAEGLDEHGQRLPGASVHDQVMALTLGLREQDHQRMIDSRLLPYLRGEDLQGAAAPSPFWAAYLIEAMERRGYGVDCLAFIRRGWAPMLETGTTWEFWHHTPDEGTVSHAWTAHPCYHLVRILTGIHQEAPGWQRISVRPQIPSGLTQARSLVPTPAGDVVCSWHQADDQLVFELQLPAGVEAEIELPDGKRFSHRGPQPLTRRCGLGV